MNIPSAIIFTLLATPLMAISQSNSSQSNHVSSFLDGFVRGFRGDAPDVVQSVNTTTQSKVSNGWNDANYNPHQVDGAMHLRIGLSTAIQNYSFSHDARLGFPQSGRETCDWNYLFYAKTGSMIGDKELEVCSLLEYHIQSSLTGVTRNLSNSFEVRDIVSEWYPFIISRIEAMKKQTRFYIHPSNFQIMPYDQNKRTFELNIFFVTEPLQHQYVYTPMAIMNRQANGGHISIGSAISLTENDARRLEQSRVSDQIDFGTPIVFFNVDKSYVGPNPDGSKYEMKRIFNISNISWKFEYLDKSGTRQTITSSL